MVVSAISAIKNLAAGKKISLYLLYRDVPEADLKMLKQFFRTKFNVEFVYRAVPAHLANIFNNDCCPEKHISNAMFDRLFIHKLIPEIDCAIYLDADTVVTGDLNELYEIDLQGKCLGAMIEVPFEYDIKTVGYNAIRLLKLDIDTFYFNSGVLLLDLKKLRKINFIQKCQEYFNKYQENIIWPDQDILNGVLGKHTHFILPKFNAEVYDGAMAAADYRDFFDFYGKTLPYTKHEIYAAINVPVVLHFLGRAKPWIHPGKYSLHKEKYWQYYNLSPWQDRNSMLVEKKLTLAVLNRKPQAYTINDFENSQPFIAEYSAN